MIYDAAIITVEEDLRLSIRFNVKRCSHSGNHGTWISKTWFLKKQWRCKSPVRSFVKCNWQWQSEAEQGGSWRHGQECVETDWERSVLFVQVCVCVCELHPPRLWATEMWFQLKPFLKVRKHAGTSSKQEIFSASSSALFSFCHQAPLPNFSKASTFFAAFSSIHWHGQMNLFVT